jgi:iron complex transport system substrate-binding protein
VTRSGDHIVAERRARVLVGILLAALALVACGGSGDGGSGGAAPSTATSAPTEPGVGEPSERILALGEERMLADLLALGVRPVASSANVVVDGGFVGIGDVDAEGIEALVSTEPNLEQLATLRPDVVVANQFVVDQLGREVLEGLGRLVVIADDDHRAQLLELGDAFDRRAEAEALLAELDDAIEAGREAFGDEPPVVSVATVYPGPSVAAWVDGPVDIPDTLIELGVTISPGPDDVDGAEGGRVFLSEEQIGILDAPILVTMQSAFVEGEDAAVAAIAADPLWAGLPAVTAGRVVNIDRLGYFGIPGRIRLVDDLVAAVADR